jgi:purine nucleosidase
MTPASPAPVAPQPVLLDCDPGIDDALAIAFACGHPGLELRGITTVAGNVGLERTTANALSVLELLGNGDIPGGIPVVAGSPAPLLRESGSGATVHGTSGLGTARLPAPRHQALPGHAVDFLVETVTASAPGEIMLAATGPLTNIALAVRREPRIVSQVAGLVIMGGSACRGNVTPAAEFNISWDPEAAAIVFGAGWRVTMVGLDVTLQALATPQVRERMRGLGRLGSELLLPGLAGYHHQTELPGGDPPVHDVCALALIAEPGLFGCRPARVEVETAGRWTSGMTVTDFASADPNALVAESVDTRALWDLVLGAYARTPAASA